MMSERSPIETWREAERCSIEQLAKASGLLAQDIKHIEAGETGIPGELQDYLTKRGVNVSQMASEQSAFIASLRQR